MGTMVGVDGFDAAKQAWVGIGKLALSLNPVAMVVDQTVGMPGMAKGELGATQLAAGKALIAYDMWGEDPARASGAVVGNVLGAVIGTKGAGAAIKGSGTVAKAGAAASRTFPKTAELAATIGGKVGDLKINVATSLNTKITSLGEKIAIPKFGPEPALAGAGGRGASVFEMTPGTRTGPAGAGVAARTGDGSASGARGIGQSGAVSPSDGLWAGQRTSAGGGAFDAGSRPGGGRPLLDEVGASARSGVRPDEVAAPTQGGARGPLVSSEVPDGPRPSQQPAGAGAADNLQTEPVGDPARLAAGTDDLPPGGNPPDEPGGPAGGGRPDGENPFFAGNDRLGAADLSRDPRVAKLTEGYDRLQGRTPEQFVDEFVDDSGTWRYPAENGFDGQALPMELKGGDVIDRFGDERGRYLSPDGTTFSERALPPDSLNPQVEKYGYHRYEIVRPFQADVGYVAPAFAQQGGGLQIFLRGEHLGEAAQGARVNVKWLLDNGYLRPTKD